MNSENNNKDLQATFDSSGGESKLNQTKRSYAHEGDGNVVDQLHSILGQSETGNELLGNAKTNNVVVNVVKNSPACIYSPVDRKIYVGLPKDAQEAPVRLALSFASALRDSEHSAMGYDIPEEGSMDAAERASIIHTKEIDKMIYQFKVAYELANHANMHEAVDVIKKMGYSDAYEVYVSERESSE